MSLFFPAPAWPFDTFSTTCRIIACPKPLPPTGTDRVPSRVFSHLSFPLLSSLSPPPSALIYDFSLITPVLPVIQRLPYHLRAYILFTTSARMFSLFASYHNLVASASTPANINNPTIQFGDVLEIPGICPPIPRSSVSPLLLIRNSLFSNIFLEDGPKLKILNGVLINTFEGLEAEALHALNGGKVTFNDGSGLPPVFPVGPFVPCEFEKLQGDDDRDQLRNWLDDQHDGSVVYVSFGSRTALSGDQIREVVKEKLSLTGKRKKKRAI